ncbi:hypothetical protein [Micromonospora rhizosphaerae]|uniref:hypothetical protein n=1 Tax=Micromonospora rhizosphaerae TaxID=568872 RepID=UPI00159F1E54|nr:hypothetical protein [Micromonospora rhizosphaerae]
MPRRRDPCAPRVHRTARSALRVTPGLYPKYKGGRPMTFTLPERREIKKIAKSKPTDHDLPFST